AGSAIGNNMLHWDGGAWSAVPVPFGAKGIAALSATNVWAVGASGGSTLVEQYTGGCLSPSATPTPTFPTYTPTITNTPTPTPSNCQPVMWNNLINVAATGNTIQKTGGVSGQWDAGASSVQNIQSGD